MKIKIIFLASYLFILQIIIETISKVEGGQLGAII